MTEQKLPCTLMRGGTSRGPYFLSTDLPQSQEEIAKILVNVMGSGHELQVEGIGGGNSLTSKVAIVGPSNQPDVDVDYLFAQVGIEERTVDFSPNCGNILSGVGPFAIEKGLVEVQGDMTAVKIRNVNTNKIIHANVQTPNGKVSYEGDTYISGVNSPGAPIELNFIGVEGAKTGKLFPTGNTTDHIGEYSISCVDAAIPVMIVDATQFGKTGYESPAELDADTEFTNKLEVLRCQAGEMMGLGDVSEKVIPKPVLIAKPASSRGTICARYYVPKRCHKAIAVTGSIAITMSLCHDGTVSSDLLKLEEKLVECCIEHPSGFIDLKIAREGDKVSSVSLIRTAKKIFEGYVSL
ncbi:4-oxalomesaconate tautomerase [Vibrio diazotrophicus]|uniref:4-oxalomesaconate tautomerase n=1 Tax=Vibrio diazotrophicus TaxID=685 RepID=UPI00142D1D0C|nr:4-oxalomesaconate tautomerase [Vibrio diazotrophicus]NIY91048.1 4-oxalomesaconate tautomerase [Vibrio diazotrophicus]